MTLLICVVLYHAACPVEHLPSTSNVVDGLEYAISEPPPTPPWWPLGTLVGRLA
jgi:hypothetical protein